MKNYLYLCLVLLLASCTQELTIVKTVSGEQKAAGMGLTLIHEHLLVDFIGADSTGYHRWNRDSVVQTMLPYLMQAKERGVKTFIDCTPAYLGRDPWLLKELSAKSGITILTNTGYYGAVDNKYLPPHAFTETAGQLANRWIGEFEEGIEGTDVFPGFIKISVADKVPLSNVHRKLVSAAAKTHLATGMAIASHTGPAAPALEEIALLEEEGVHPSAFIWVHAQMESDFSHYKTAAEKGAWISLDGVVWALEEHLDRLVYCRENDLLDQVLISHDAGWYQPGEPNGGDIKPFVAIFDALIPMLKENGFTEAEINKMLVENPARAFALSVRRK